LSLSSPRSQKEPFAPQLLGLLAILPDGYSAASERLDQLQLHLSLNVSIWNVLHVLNRTALIHIVGTTETRRYQLLPPVHQFAHTNIEVPPTCKTALIKLYVQFIVEQADYTDPLAHHIIIPEMLNIHSVLFAALSKNLVDDDIYLGAICYSQWRIYCGSATKQIILLAVERSAETLSIYNGSCLRVLGQVYIAKNDLQKAELALLQASALHKQAQDAHSEGSDLLILGQLYIILDQLEKAESSFLQAVNLHKQAQSIHGEGDDQLGLGGLYM
jgi:tetratricopeptide (TPR) repeat protein